MPVDVVLLTTLLATSVLQKNREEGGVYKNINETPRFKHALKKSLNQLKQQALSTKDTSSA
jgi:hypothetical protein